MNGFAVRKALLGALLGSIVAISTPASTEEGQPVYPKSAQEVWPILSACASIIWSNLHHGEMV